MDLLDGDFAETAAFALAVLEQIVGQKRRAEKALRAQFRSYRFVGRHANAFRAAASNWVLGVCCLRRRLDRLLALVAHRLLPGSTPQVCLPLRVRLACWLAIFVLEPGPGMDAPNPSGGPARVRARTPLMCAWLRDELECAGGATDMKPDADASLSPSCEWLARLPTALPAAARELDALVRTALASLAPTSESRGCRLGHGAVTNEDQAQTAGGDGAKPEMGTAAGVLADAGSLPPWLWCEWCDQFGARAALALACASNRPAGATLRACARLGRDALAMDVCEQEGWYVLPTVLSPWGLRVASPAKPNIWGSGAWRAGRFEVMDEGSQLIALACCRATRVPGSSAARATQDVGDDECAARDDCGASS